MNRKASFMVILTVFSMLMLTGTSRCGTPADKRILDAPEPGLSMTLDEALFQRKSVRTFRDDPLTLEEVSGDTWDLLEKP